MLPRLQVLEISGKKAMVQIPQFQGPYFHTDAPPSIQLAQSPVEAQPMQPIILRYNPTNCLRDTMSIETQFKEQEPCHALHLRRGLGMSRFSVRSGSRNNLWWLPVGLTKRPKLCPAGNTHLYRSPLGGFLYIFVPVSKLTVC